MCIRDSERLAGVVGSDFDTDYARAAVNVVRCDFLARTCNLLVRARVVQCDVARLCGEQEIAVRIEFEFIGAFDAHADASRASARSENVVGFELSLVAVVDQVHTGIDAMVFYAGEVGDVAAPLLSLIHIFPAVPVIVRV